MTAIHAGALVKRWGSFTAVDGIDLDVADGECVGLLGPNGAGKTTIVRLLLGLSTPTSGRIEVLGHPVPEDARAMRLRVGVVPQIDNLDPDFTVRENLQVYARYFGIPRATLEGRVESLLRFASLESRADSPIGQLSGGMKRRLTIARALVADPKIVFLDEPTTGLDPQARHLVWRRLRELRAEGRTLVLTTHSMDEAERLCDRVVVLDRGRVLDSGSPRALIERHIEPHVVEASGDAPAVDRAAAERGLADRFERVGETAFFYSRTPERLLAAFGSQPDLRIVHRPANLEDVFLRLTGRELREE